MKWQRRKRRRTSKDTPRRVLLRQMFWGVLLILLVSGLIYGVWYFTRLPAFNINSVHVAGGETIDHSDIQVRVEKVLSGEYLHLVPKRFVWTYPRTAIVTAVEERDRIKSVQVERDGQELTVVFEEYHPAALWCERPSDQNCFFIDQGGFAFAKAPHLEGSSFVRYSDNGRMPEARVRAFSEDFIADSKRLMDAIYDELGFNTIQVERSGVGEVIYHLAGGGDIKVSTHMSAEDTLTNLAAVLTSKEFAHLQPGNFQYIDLRYGNKVFVNEEIEEVEVATSTAEVALEAIDESETRE